MEEQRSRYIRGVELNDRGRGAQRHLFVADVVCALHPVVQVLQVRPLGLRWLPKDLEHLVYLLAVPRCRKRGGGGGGGIRLKGPESKGGTRKAKGASSGTGKGQGQLL